jgi:hypothetical protein
LGSQASFIKVGKYYQDLNKEMHRPKKTEKGKTIARRHSCDDYGGLEMEPFRSRHDFFFFLLKAGCHEHAHLDRSEPSWFEGNVMYTLFHLQSPLSCEKKRSLAFRSCLDPSVDKPLIGDFYQGSF